MKRRDMYDTVEFLLIFIGIPVLLGCWVHFVCGSGTTELQNVFHAGLGFFMLFVVRFATTAGFRFSRYWSWTDAIPLSFYLFFIVPVAVLAPFLYAREPSEVSQLMNISEEIFLFCKKHQVVSYVLILALEAVSALVLLAFTLFTVRRNEL